MGGRAISGVLSVVATPIGNLDDLSPRAAATLMAADVLACEDTRVARTLLARAAALHARLHASAEAGSGPAREGAASARVRIRGRLVAYHARNESERAPELVRAVASGARVALTTDAGMPGLSDPGRRLVAACVEAGLRVEVIPGPSAVLTALVASGLPTARFVFEGFLPRTAAARRRRLEALAAEERTIVFFEAPHRLAESLEAMAATLGARRAAVARELTKLHEEVLRGTLPELADHVRESGVRGEVAVVVEGVPAAARRAAAGAGRDSKELAAAVAARIAHGAVKRDAIAAVAAVEDVPKKVVYQAVLDHPVE